MNPAAAGCRRLLAVMVAATQSTESAQVVPAQPSAAAVGDPPLLEPAFSVTIDAPAQFRGIVFHPDGTRAFVHVSDPAIDLWPLAVYYWPEILGGLAALLALPALWVIWRRARRPRRVGRVYCRKCNYELGPAGAEAKSEKRKANIQTEPAAEAAVPTRCPECGTETAKRRPIRGRRMRRRLAQPVAGVLAVGAAYGGMHAAGLPREGLVSPWLSLPSRACERIVASAGIARDAGCWRDVDRVQVLDLRMDRRLRTLCTRSSSTWFDVAISSDGSLLFLSGDEAGGVDALDTATGRIVAQVRGGNPPACVVIPSEVDTAEVFVFRWGPSPPKTIVERWRLGEEEPADAFDVPWGRDGSFHRQPLLRNLLPQAAGAAWVEYPVTRGARPGPEPTARLLSLAGDVVGTFPMPPVGGGWNTVLVASPGPSLVTMGEWPRRLERWKLPDGHPEPSISLPRALDARGELWAAGSRILVGPVSDDAWIYDTAAERWVARLRLPGLPDATRFGLSGCGRFAFANAFNVGTLRYDAGLVIWDLSRISPAADEPAPSGP